MLKCIVWLIPKGKAIELVTGIVSITFTNNSFIMKRKIHILSACIALMILSIPSMSQTTGLITDTVIMGPGYANEVYYNLSDGNQWSVGRKQWDIAFRASRMSASILTNDAANNNAIGLSGVELYTYDNSDTSGWASVDTTGLFTWKLLVNSTTDWETGAFCQNQTGHPDYGWGKYNTASHDVLGDSIFIIKLRDGSFRKLWIIRKYSAENKFEFRYANLDGTQDTTIMLDCSPYSSKNFVGFSLTTHQVVDFEPANSDQWTLLFTKYMYTYPDGVLYPVTGVLSNYDIKINRFEHVSPDFRMFDLTAMDSTRSSIGWEWKYLDGSFVYHVVDSLVHFIQDQDANIYRLVFKEFAGTSTGRIVFDKELLSLASVPESANSFLNMTVFPNPAVSVAFALVNPGNESSVHLSLKDMAGRMVWNESFRVDPHSLNKIQIPIEELPSGIYILRTSSKSAERSMKLIVK